MNFPTTVEHLLRPNDEPHTRSKSYSTRFRAERRDATRVKPEAQVVEDCLVTDTFLSRKSSRPALYDKRHLAEVPVPHELPRSSVNADTLLVDTCTPISTIFSSDAEATFTSASQIFTTHM